MLLFDEDSGMMDASCEAFFEKHSLQSSIHEFMQSEAQNVIQFVLIFSQKTISNHSSHQSGSFEKSSGVFFIKSQQFSCSLTNSSQDQLDSPDFSLVFETIFTNDLHLIVETFFLERSSWGFEGFGGLGNGLRRG